jgi:hypothetical protein
MGVSNNLVSGRAPVVGYGNLTPSRYQFLALGEAEPNLGPGDNNSVLVITTGNTRSWTQDLNITSVSASGNVTVGNIVITAGGNIDVANAYINNLAYPVQLSDAATKQFVLDNAGNIGNLGNLTFSNTTISTSLVNGNITLTPTGNAILIVDTTTGLQVPVGNTAQRPTPATTGTLRFNTDLTRLEVYDGTEWDQMVGGVTNQTITSANGNTVSFALDRNTTAAAALIMLNGVVQIPGVAYTVSPAFGNTLIFVEAPQSNDIIDVRFL